MRWIGAPARVFLFFSSQPKRKLCGSICCAHDTVSGMDSRVTEVKADRYDGVLIDSACTGLPAQPHYASDET